MITLTSSLICAADWLCYQSCQHIMAVIIVLLDAIEVDFHTDKQILALISKFIPNVELIEKLNKYAMKCNDFEYQMHHTAPHFLGEPLRKILDDLFLTTYDFF